MGDIKRSDESRTVQERILSLKYNLQADLQRTENIAGNYFKLISARQDTIFLKNHFNLSHLVSLSNILKSTDDLFVEQIISEDAPTPDFFDDDYNFVLFP